MLNDLLTISPYFIAVTKVICILLLAVYLCAWTKMYR